MIPRFSRAATFTGLALSACLVLSGIGLAAATQPAEEPGPQQPETQHEAGFRALVFSKVTNFYHESIPAGIAAIEALGDEHGFETVVTDDSSIFNHDDLATFDVVIFNNTNSTPQSGDLLNAQQREAFVRYIENGGGWVGLHSASGSERNWEWYEGLVGAIFSNHPPGENPDGTIPGRVKVTDRVHPSTQHLPEVWRHDEEWYNFDVNPTGDVHVLAQIDTKVGIEGLQMGHHHPFSWCQVYEGGRSWYTGGGHSAAAFDNDDFVQHLLGGIEWAAGTADGDCGATVEDNFEKTLLERNLVDPMELAVAPDGRVFVIERTGGVKIWHPDTRQTTTAGRLDVHLAHTHGLNGLTLDPDFAENGWIYLYYSPPGTDHHVLSRFTMNGDTLDMGSEVVVLEVDAQRSTNAHEAGSMTWDGDGNLYLATGDNSIPTEYSPIDERSGQEFRDAQRSSGNTNDLRGKILRITPQPDGSYIIPDGNLFADDGSELTRPEIYTMGHRQPYRIHYDEPSGRLLWGDVGPDAHNPDASRGPAGYDEFHYTTEPGNFGWPYCRGGEAYRDYNFATGASGGLFDCATGPVNRSPNNTGLEQLPPVSPPEIWYPYDWANHPDAPPFPELGNGGRLALAGPVYQYDPGLESETKFPAYYDGKWFVAEWIRGWMKTASITETGHAFDAYPDVAAGDVYSIDPFMDSTTFLRPHDMEFGPEGSLYLLEWGSNYGGAGRGDPNDDSGLYRIDYLRGSRSPVAVAKATPSSGAVPLTIEFSSEGTHQPDGLAYDLEWSFGDGTTSTEAHPTHTYTEPGNYTAQLVVTDTNGRQGFANVAVTAGNTRPEVNVVTPLHGGFVADGQQVEFEVEVTDAEDGSTADGTIDCADVQVQPYLGHDDHAHPLDLYHDCTGTFEIDLGEGHAWHDNYWLLLDASYSDKGADGAGSLTGGEQIVLQPKRKQAEHFTSSSDVQVVQMGANEGSEQQPGGAVVGHIGHGDWVSYDPVNFTGLEAVKFHVNSAGFGGYIEARVGSPDGELLGEPVQVPITGDNWRANFVDVTLKLNPTAVPDGPFELYLVFTHPHHQDATTGLFNLHWMVALKPAVLTLDAGEVASPVATGYQQLAPRHSWDPASRDYGWVGSPPQARDRGNSFGPVSRDFVNDTVARTLRIAVPPGPHDAELLVGDGSFPSASTYVRSGGELLAQSRPLGVGEFEWLTFPLNGGASGREVDLQLAGNAGQHWHLNALVMR